MEKFDVQSLPLGPKPRAWTTAVLGNLERLAKDQSVSSKIRSDLEAIRKLIFVILNQDTENGEWTIQFVQK